MMSWARCLSHRPVNGSIVAPAGGELAFAAVVAGMYP